MRVRPVTGQVVETVGGVYRVRAGGDVVEATLRGRLKRGGDPGEARVVIGDMVRLAVDPDDGAVVEAVLPRRTTLARRPSRSRRSRVVAANLDRLVVVASVLDPPPSRPVIDRLLVVGESGGMRCRLALNKVDLRGGPAAAAALADSYRRAGYPAIATSAATGEGIDAFRALVGAGSSVLAGPSGVGKSALLNAVEPGLGLRTRAVGRRSRTGRHTTVSSRLIPLARGGSVADTPGFSDVGVGGVDAARLGALFPDFRPFLGRCRFRDCAHAGEPDCAVRAALDAERIQPERYRSYRDILSELREAT